MTGSVLVVGDDEEVTRVTTRQFLEQGCKVAVLAPAFDGIEKYGGAVRVVADFTDARAIAGAVEEARNGVGQFSNVVTFAGMPTSGRVDEVGIDGWTACLNRTLTTAFLVAACTISDLVSSHGSFVAVTSTVGVRGSSRNAAYAAASHGIIGLVKSMALDHARQGVRCNVICTGLVEGNDASRQYGVREVPDSRIPARRLARPDEIAHLVRYLTSDRASYATGSVVVIDGALSAGLLKEHG